MTTLLGELRDIPLDALFDAPWNARRTFDAAQQKELEQSIRQGGVQVPLVVRRMADCGGKPVYEVIAGARRRKALLSLGIPNAPCLLRELNDAQAREVGLVDNLQRADLEPLEEAQAYQEMLALAARRGEKLAPAELAAKLGKPEGYVRLRLKLLSAEEPVRKALADGELPLAHAVEIAQLAAPDQRRVMDWLKTWREGVSFRRLHEHIVHEVLLDLGTAPFDVEDAQLMPSAGSCVACPKRTGRDNLLFADVREKDRCADSGCFNSKTARHIDVTIGQLRAKGYRAVGLSWERSGCPSAKKGWPAGLEVLTGRQYEPLRSHPRGRERCAGLAIGVWVDGAERGKTERICMAKDCKVHRLSAHASSPGDAKRRAAARREKQSRMRMMAAAVERLTKRGPATDAEIRALAAYALERGDHHGVLAILREVGWPGGFAALPKKLGAISTGAAAGIGLLASVASLLTVSDYSIGHSAELERVVKGLGVDVAAVRRQLAAEIAAKAKKKPAGAGLTKPRGHAIPRGGGISKPSQQPARKAAKNGGRK